MIKRESVLKRIRPFYESELIKILIGLRRSGKSVLLHETNYPKYVISMDKMDFSREGIIHLNAVKFLSETI